MPNIFLISIFHPLSFDCIKLSGLIEWFQHRWCCLRGRITHIAMKMVYTYFVADLLLFPMNHNDGTGHAICAIVISLRNFIIRPIDEDNLAFWYFASSVGINKVKSSQYFSSLIHPCALLFSPICDGWEAVVPFSVFPHFLFHRTLWRNYIFAKSILFSRNLKFSPHTLRSLWVIN